jgi:hypothetical protein
MSFSLGWAIEDLRKIFNRLRQENVRSAVDVVMDTVRYIWMSSRTSDSIVLSTDISFTTVHIVLTFVTDTMGTEPANFWFQVWIADGNICYNFSEPRSPMTNGNVENRILNIRTCQKWGGEHVPPGLSHTSYAYGLVV